MTVDEMLAEIDWISSRLAMMRANEPDEGHSERYVALEKRRLRLEDAVYERMMGEAGGVC